MSLVSTVVVLMLAAPLPQVASQSKPASSPAFEQASANPGNTTAIVPQQLRRAAPPPTNASAEQLESIGDSLRGENLFADALDYYRAAMKKADSPVLHDKAGIAELQMVRHEEARREFERAIKMDKHYAEAYNNLGVIAYFHKKYGKANKLYKKAIELRDENASFHSNYGAALFAEKAYEKAFNEYSRALRLDPEIFDHTSRTGVIMRPASVADRAHYDYVIAKIYASQGNPDRCLLYLRKAMEDGYSQINDVYKDGSFIAIRKDPRFVSLMAQRPVSIPDTNPPNQ
ncbi:MAG TPA: tetratricopeptide repeat protein [Terriglobales bacterium]|nr:tetratricopeptide repeat protein [Terriglobales bacterium]